MATSFGPSALATPANGVTVGRLLAAPFLFVLIDGKEGSWLAFVLWFGLCITDGIDGYLARRHGTTRSGAFLDPLADKVLVLGAMLALVKQDVFWWLPVALIATRRDCDQHVPQHGGAARDQHPGEARGEGEDCLPAARGGLRTVAVVSRLSLALQRLPVGRGRPHAGHRRAVPVRCSPSRARTQLA